MEWGIVCLMGDKQQRKTSTERSEGDSEQPFGSTRFVHKRVRMTRPPEARRYSGPKGLRWKKLPRQDWRKPVHLTITYRGGAEAWVEIHARGDLGRYTGDAQIIDILMDITGNR